MIGTAKLVFGLIAGAAMLIAVTIALFADLFAPETRPTLRLVRVTRKRRAVQSLMEAGT